MQITKGKRYTWHINHINNYEDKMKDGFFTGDFDKNNGNAILMTKEGEFWSIPLQELREVNKK